MQFEKYGPAILKYKMPLFNKCLVVASEYILIFRKQVRITGEIVMIHIACKAVIFYNREKWLPGHATHYLPWLIRCELRG